MWFGQGGGLAMGGGRVSNLGIAPDIFPAKGERRPIALSATEPFECDAVNEVPQAVAQLDPSLPFEQRQKSKSHGDHHR